MRIIFCLFLPLLFRAQDTVKVALNLSAEQVAEMDYNNGLLAIKNKDYQAAAELLGKSIAARPSFDKAYAGRAVAYSNLKKFKEALEDINAALRLNNSSEYHFNKSLIFLGLNLRDSQEVALDRSLAINAENPDAAYYKGLRLFEKGDYEKSIGFYSIAILSRRDFVNAYNDRASAKRARGDLAGAIEDYEKAVRLDSNIAFILNNLGSAYRLYKSYDKAVIYHTAALRKDPKYHIALLNRGATYFESNDLKRAQADFEQVLSSDARNSSAYNNLASIAIRQKDYKKAKDLASRSIELDAGNGPAYYNRGIARQMLRDEEGCCQDWKTAVKLGVEGARLFLNATCAQ